MPYTSRFNLGYSTLQIRLVAVLIAFFIMCSVVVAQDNCYPHDTAYTPVQTRIRPEADFLGKVIDFTRTGGENHEVLRSTSNDGYCWLRISEGWILSNSVETPKASDTEPDASAGCYPNNIAYISGSMNIRERATTDSDKVGVAYAGQSFPVAESRPGETWCWLRIDKGWLADTSRVQPTKPTYVAPSPRVETQQNNQQPANVNNCCYVNRECNTDEEWTNGYWAYQNNECPVSSQSSSISQPQETPPRRGEGGLQPIPGSGGNFFEFLGEGEYTTATIPLTQGTWNMAVITAATTLAYAESPGDRCFGRWRGDRILVASKSHNIFGGDNEANGQFAVTKDCNVRFYVWAPRHRWSLKLQKV